MYGSKNNGLTAKQQKLPEALKRAILASKSKSKPKPAPKKKNGKKK
jgi:predicted metal-binding protein|tara:strand:+ start:403 stop:540 length:138 start_codon:yes stop_codon:yes gene_type:complete